MYAPVEELEQGGTGAFFVGRLTKIPHTEDQANHLKGGLKVQGNGGGKLAVVQALFDTG